MNIAKLKEKSLNLVSFAGIIYFFSLSKARYITKNEITPPSEKEHVTISPLLLLNGDMAMKPFIEDL